MLTIPKNVKVMEKATIKKIARVLEVLKQNPGMHIRGIAKILNYMPGTVAWIINRYLYRYVKFELTEIGGFKIKYVRLVKDVDVEDVLKVIEVQRKIRNV